MHSLSATDAIRLRLVAHGLTEPRDATPTAVLERMVALQGQDLPAVLGAIALRSRTEEEDVRAAFDRGDLVRSWPMRGTLFATTPRHLAALLSLTADRVLATMARRRDNLGIDDTTIDTAREVALERLGAGRASRAELLAAWDAAGLETRGGPGYHLILYLAIRGLVHWGPFDGTDQLLVATDTVQLHPDDEDGDRLLARVVRGYLAGRGPATVDDIAWWLKLPKRDVTRGVEGAGADVAHLDVDGRPMLVLAADLDQLGALSPADDGRVWLLPAFDEYYLGYQDRSLVSTSAMDDLVVPGRNGVFRPVVVVDGQVVGTWRRTRTGAELTAMADVPAATRRLVDDALASQADTRDARPGGS